MGEGLETEERLRELQGARKAHATLHGNLLRSAAEKKTLKRFEVGPSAGGDPKPVTSNYLGFLLQGYQIGPILPGPTSCRHGIELQTMRQS